MVNIFFLKKRKLIVNIILLCVTLILLFLIAEIIFRIYYEKSGKIICATQEECCSRELYHEVSNISNPDRFYLDPFTPWKYVLQYSSIYGEIPKPNCGGRTNFVFNITFYDGTEGALLFYGDTATNSQNLRGVKDYSLKKDPKKLRIALFGDSYTWGAETWLKFNYPNFLERLIPNSESLNFGIFGAGIDLMYLRWKYEALKFKPDVTVMTIFTNDIARARPCMYKPQFKIENDKLIIKNIPPPSREEIAEDYKPPELESYFIKHIVHNFLYWINSGAPDYNYGFEILLYMLDEMKKTSEKDNTFFMVAIINSNGKPTEEEIKQYTRLKNLLEKMDISYIESFEVFKKEGYDPYDPKLYTLEGSHHFSPLGNALFAQAIKNMLEEKSIIAKQKNYYFEHYYEKDIKLDTLDTMINTQIVIMRNKDNPDEQIPILPFEILKTRDINLGNYC